MEALAGRCNTLLSVSLILAVVATSDAVLFQTQIISSWIKKKYLLIKLNEVN